MKTIETRKVIDHTFTLKKERGYFGAFLFLVEWKKLDATILNKWFPSQRKAHQFIRDNVKGVQGVANEAKG